MTLGDRFRKAKVVASNVNQAFGVVGQGLSGGLLGGSKRTPVYNPVRYKSARKGSPKSLKEKARVVGKKLGDLAVAERKYGYTGPKGFSKVQDTALFGTSSGRSGVGDFYSLGGKSKPRGLKNPHFNYERI